LFLNAFNYSQLIRHVFNRIPENHC
jgi:hypothetical protein